MDQRTLREYYTRSSPTSSRRPARLDHELVQLGQRGARRRERPADGDLARRDLGLDRYFTSDCDAVHEIQAATTGSRRARPRPLDQYGRTATPSRPVRTWTATGATTTPTATGTPSRTAIGRKIKTQTDTFDVGDVDASLVRLFTARIETGEFDQENQVPWVRAARARLGGGTWVTLDANNAVTETPDRLAQAQPGRRAEPGALEERPGRRAKAPLLPLRVPLRRLQGRGGRVLRAPAALFTGGYSGLQGSAPALPTRSTLPGIKSRDPRDQPGRHRSTPTRRHGRHHAPR